MKSFAKMISLLWLMSLLFIPNVSVHANDFSTTSLNENNSGQLLSEFEKLYEQLANLDRYQMNFSFHNIEHNQLVYEGRILSDRATGNSRYTVTFYEDIAEDITRPVTVDLITYQEFKLAYINLLDILDATGFYGQDYFDGSLSSELSALEDIYVAIDMTEASQINLIDELFYALAFLPNIELVDGIAEEHVYRLNNTTIVDMERLEIPRAFYENSGRFHLNYRFNMAIAPTEDRFTAFDVNMNQQLEVSQSVRGLSMNITLDSQITEELLPLPLENNQSTPEDFQWHKALNTNSVTDKLTKATLSFDSNQPSYHVALTGLFEELSLNIFNIETADFESYNHRLMLEILPSEEDFPLPQEIERMTINEFEVKVENLLQSANNQTID